MKKILSFLSKLKGTYTRKQRTAALIIGIASSILFIVIISAYIAFTDVDMNPFAFVDDFIYDHFARMRYDASLEAKKGLKPIFNEDQMLRVAFIEIDEASLATPGFGQWPLPRSKYAELINKLESAGVKCIGFDILFTEPSQNQKADQIFADTLKKYNNVFLAMMHVSAKETAENMGKETEGKKIDIIKPFPLLYSALKKDKSENLGFVTESLGYGGVVRNALLVWPEEKKNSLSLATVLYCFAEGISFDSVQLSPAGDYIKIGNMKIPAYKGEVWLNYGYIPPKPGEELANTPAALVSRYSISDVLLKMDDAARTGEFTDKIVLVGVTAAAGFDIKGSPFGQEPAMYAHANILLSLLSNSFIKRATPLNQFIVILIIGLIVSLVIPAMDPRMGTVFAIFLGFGVYEYSYWNFLNNSTLNFISAPMLTLFVSFVSINIYHYTAEQKAKKKLSGLFKEFAPLPDAYLEEILASSGGAVLGGKKTEMSILFSDIRGYTDLSERLDPVSVMETLNEYHAAMGQIFHENGGTIFDYQGDAQMVVFGIVDPSKKNHAFYAVKTALEMQSKLAELREQWQKEGKHSFEIGVGICSGDVSLGIVGSAQRKQYAAIGDSTNVAARLQGKSKELDSPVLIAETTYEKCKDLIIADELPPVALKGKSELLKVYRALRIK
ncbi:MAG: adenylate/guanylate cyclase domain-containing protein [Firmicutes bacterium]|nr:adenylate/guanylate cyclase domain-containing protein [Bacillota bacterium]